MRATRPEDAVPPPRAGRARCRARVGCPREVPAPEDSRHADRDAVAASHPRRGDHRRPAVFLDRDGTLIEDVPYLSDPADVRLFPGAAEALMRLQHAGFVLVLVTNQSGIGRGFFTEDRLGEIHDELEGRLAARGVSLDGIYYCPAVPAEGGGPDCPDRKPSPGMLLRGADELGLDLDASWMVGDKMSDVMAGLNAGCRSILLRADPAASDVPEPDDAGAAGRYLVATDLVAAVELILQGERREP
jgi:D,D-heptose 1,7-bisphosphate phosphatase